jgi:hypothetical protein
VRLHLNKGAGHGYSHLSSQHKIGGSWSTPTRAKSEIKSQKCPEEKSWRQSPEFKPHYYQEKKKEKGPVRPVWKQTLKNTKQPAVEPLTNAVNKDSVLQAT